MARHFDSKMRTAEALAPGHSAAIRTIADILRADWQRSVAFDRTLSERLPHLHGALERGRRRLLVNVLTQDPGHPWAAIRSSQSLAEAAFSDDFLPLYGASRVENWHREKRHAWSVRVR